LSSFSHFLTWLQTWGPIGILFLAILDSAGVPVAGVFDALLILIAVERPGIAWLCAGLAVLGSTAGNAILFQAAHRSGSRFVMRAEPGTWTARFRTWFYRYGLITVFVPALLPIPMPLKVFVVSAGVTRTPFAKFITVILLARGIRYFGEAWLGVALGKNSATFLAKHAWEFIVGAVVLFVVLFIWVRWKDQQRVRKQNLI
jgi:membrane protein DedA with SNARE-associated domain